MLDFISALPKVELHVHLVGSASVPTVLELARRHPERGVPTEEAALRAYYEFTDFPHFIDVYTAVNRLVRTGADVTELVLGLARDHAANNVRYAEVTVTPTSHLKSGIDPAEVAEALTEGRRLARERYGVEYGWVFDIDGVDLRAGAPITMDWVRGHRPDGTVALGLGGPEVGVPRAWFRDQFDEARELGLRCLPHAGETTGPETVWSALTDLGAERIGHGTSAARDARLMAHLADHDIAVEVCPTSNIRTKAVDTFARHPLPVLLDSGVPVTLATDDPGMFHTTVNQEYLTCHEVFGFDRKTLAELVITGVRASYAPDVVKTALLADIKLVQNSDHV